MMGIRVSDCAAMAALASMTLSGPAAAADDATTGVVAALGLAAGSGKTTLTGSAGATEASIIQAQAVNRTGWIIAQLVEAAEAKAGTVFVLAKTDQPDLSAAESMQLNIDTLTANFQALKDQKIACEAAKPGGGGAPGGPPGAAALVETPVGAAKDVAALIATDTSVAGLTISNDDRVIIDAILANADLDVEAQWAAAQKVPAKGDAKGSETLYAIAPHGAVAAASKTSFIVPAESVHANLASSALYTSYKGLLGTASAARSCTDKSHTGAVAAFDAFATKATTIGDKGAASPMTLAIEQEALSTDTGDVLRVAVEQTGGTSITRSGVLYTLGLPNAATVTSGLVTSFRLVDPKSGKAKLSGFVRCISAPISFKKVKSAIDQNLPLVSCSYLAAPVRAT